MHVDTCGYRPCESNDCSVRAITALSGLEYSKVHTIFELCGRKRFKGTPLEITFKVCTAIDLKLTMLLIPTRIRWGSLRRAIPKEGKYLVQTTKHHFAIIDGVEYNNPTPESDRKVVRAIYKVD